MRPNLGNHYINICMCYSIHFLRVLFIVDSLFGMLTYLDTFRKFALYNNNILFVDYYYYSNVIFFSSIIIIIIAM
jgi:hypothetical protein